MSDIRTVKYDVIDKSSGELESRVNINYNGNTHRAVIIHKDRGKPKKTTEPFILTNTCMIDFDLTLEEKGVFFSLTMMVGWENNFISDDNGYISVLELSKKLKTSRPTLIKILKSLESKEILRIVSLGNKKIIYLYSKYVWKGSERNRNDTKLHDLLADVLRRAKPKIPK